MIPPNTLGDKCHHLRVSEVSRPPGRYDCGKLTSKEDIVSEKALGERGCRDMVAAVRRGRPMRQVARDFDVGLLTVLTPVPLGVMSYGLPAKSSKTSANFRTLVYGKRKGERAPALDVRRLALPVTKKSPVQIEGPQP